MDEDNVLRRWFTLEMGNMMELFVAHPKPLLELLRETTPAVATKSGQLHIFDTSVLREFADALPALTRAQIRLPLTMHFSHETPGDAYVAEQPSNDAIRTLFPATSPPRDGRLWLSKPLAREFARRYPTLIQFVMH